VTGGGDRLGGVDDAAAADRGDHVGAMLARGHRSCQHAGPQPGQHARQFRGPPGPGHDPSGRREFEADSGHTRNPATRFGP
jgi:hypothetical protein